MNKRIWAAALAAAVMVTSAVTIPYKDVQMAAAAAQSSSSGGEVEDTSADGRTTAGGFTFRVAGNEATITGYSGAAKELSIPTKIKYEKPGTGNGTGSGSGGSGSGGSSNENAVEYAVTAIAENAFSGNLGIQKLTMSGGINSEGKAYGIKTI